MRRRPTELARTVRGARDSLVALGILSSMTLVPCPRVGAAPAFEVAEDLRPFLVAAIDAPDGRAAGVLAGSLAETLRKQGVSAAPLRVEVTTLRTYREPGCRRLNILFRQREVKLGDAPPTDRAAAFQLNYCRDGRPPRSLE